MCSYKCNDSEPKGDWVKVVLFEGKSYEEVHLICPKCVEKALYTQVFPVCKICKP